jgi:translation initiation factor IF-2
VAVRVRICLRNSRLLSSTAKSEGVAPVKKPNGAGPSGAVPPAIKPKFEFKPPGTSSSKFAFSGTGLVFNKGGPNPPAANAPTLPNSGQSNIPDGARSPVQGGRWNGTQNQGQRNTLSWSPASKASNANNTASNAEPPGPIAGAGANNSMGQRRRENGGSAPQQSKFMFKPPGTDNRSTSRPGFAFSAPQPAANNNVSDEVVAAVKSKFSFGQSAPASFSVTPGQSPNNVPRQSNVASSDNYNRFRDYVVTKSNGQAANGYQQAGLREGHGSTKSIYAERANTDMRSGDKNKQWNRNGESNNGRNTNGFDSKRRPKSSSAKTVVKLVSISDDGISMRDLASRLSTKMDTLAVKVRTLDDNKALASDSADELGNYVVDADIAELVVMEMGFEVKRDKSKNSEEGSISRKANESARAASCEYPLLPRAPVVCIMGHVDHGKTTLLDTLRKANVADGEDGGITQKISAFKVQIKSKQVVFLDTPGHQAFASMRASGALATDVAVLVVAADDGVRPTTIEAFNTAKESGCQILIALNKMDKIPESEKKDQRRKVLTQLMALGCMVEEFGGDIPVVEVSGKTGAGLDNLIDMLSLQTEILELKAPEKGPGEAVVLESVIEKGRGVLVDVVVNWGTLHVGDCIVAGTSYGKVKAIIDDKGKSIKSAPPSTPVQILGLRNIASAGQELIVVPSEAKGKEISDRRLKIQEMRKLLQTTTKAAADANRSTEGVITSINVMLKADSAGTLEALGNIVQGVKNRVQNVGVNVIHSSVGVITDNDIDKGGSVMTDSLVSTCVLGFNVAASESTRQLAKQLDVKLFRGTVIYRLEDSLMEEMASLLPKERHESDEGTANVLQLFNLNNKASTVVAGLDVETGHLRMTDKSGTYLYRVKRGNDILADNLEVAELRRFKDVVPHVRRPVMIFKAVPCLIASVCVAG